MIACPAPDATLGVALRLSSYVDCEARALGENGLQALIGGPVIAGLLSGLVTIFVALIGYRLILGQSLSVRDGTGWAVRLGIVLALTTGWPAFQTLFYDVAVNGPGELAAVLLPASGLPAEDLDGRVQQAYDTMRLGTVEQTSAAQDPMPQGSSPAQAIQPQPSAVRSPSGQLPQTASAFVLSTYGVIAAFRIATGFLLAIGPLAALALLFDATLGLFSGWLRALTGAALASLAAMLVTALDLTMVESELANLQVYGQGMVLDTTDPQAMTTLVLVFAIAVLVATGLALRVASAISFPSVHMLSRTEQPPAVPAINSSAVRAHSSIPGVDESRAGERPRSAVVADALATTVARERVAAAALGVGTDALAFTAAAQGGVSHGGTTLQGRLVGQIRRGTGRRTRRAAARDAGR